MDATPHPTGSPAPAAGESRPPLRPLPPLPARGPHPLRRPIFDVSFGIVLPLVCFAFDPIVFVDERWIGLGYWPYRILAWTFAGAQMLALAAALAGGRRPPVESAVVAGVLGAGALFACVVAFALLPLSLNGLIAIIGVLGLVPFATAFVYGRAALRALRDAAGFRWRALVAVAAFLVATAVPVGVQLGADAMVSEWIEAAVQRPVGPPDDALLLAARVAPRSVEQLEERHAMARDEVGRMRIAQLYVRLSGKPMPAGRSDLSRLAERGGGSSHAHVRTLCARSTAAGRA